jgi:hypothetical protein
MRAGLLRCIGTAVIIAAVATTAVAAPKPAVDVKATLRGEVLPDDLAKPGDEVREGAPLVYVKTQTGRGVAPARPRMVALEVLVRPGALIRELGAVVARLDPK